MLVEAVLPAISVQPCMEQYRTPYYNLNTSNLSLTIMVRSRFWWSEMIILTNAGSFHLDTQKLKMGRMLKWTHARHSSYQKASFPLDLCILNMKLYVQWQEVCIRRTISHYVAAHGAKGGKTGWKRASADHSRFVPELRLRPEKWPDLWPIFQSFLNNYSLRTAVTRRLLQRSWAWSHPRRLKHSLRRAWIRYWRFKIWPINVSWTRRSQKIIWKP